MIVHQTAGLHERVGGGGADEAEAALLQVLAERGGLRSARGQVGQLPGRPAPPRGRMRPDEPRERLLLRVHRRRGARVRDRRLDLARVAEDAGLVKGAPDVALREGGNRLNLEVVERRAEVLPLPQDRQPRQARLEALEHHPLVEASVVRHRPSPLLVVVDGVVRRGRAPPAAPPAVVSAHERAQAGQRIASRAVNLRRDRPALWSSLAASDTGRAAGMAAAVIAANVIALVITVVFARLLGASGYGSLAALMSAFIILMVPGSALQIAVAREVSRDAGGPDAGAGVRRWLARLAVAALVVAALAIPLRGAIAAAIGVEEEWGAAAVPVTAMLWTLLSVIRGALQGFGLYRTVALSIIGEGVGRLVLGLALVGVGLDVTGAFLGTPLSMLAVAAALAPWLRPHLPASAGAGVARLRDLLAGARAPVAGLTLLFVLQEVHVIVVKHEASGDAAGSYAVAAVAAKAIIWVAVGLGLYL